MWGAYWTLTSIYCLLAYLPYTYCALIKAPPYLWVPWFVHHHVALHWVALLAGVAAFWPDCRTVRFGVLFGMQAVFGAYLIVHPILSNLQNDLSAYVWSAVALLPVILVAAMDQLRDRVDSRTAPGTPSLLDYTGVVLAAAIVSLLYAVGAHVRYGIDSHSWTLRLKDLELAVRSPFPRHAWCSDRYHSECSFPGFQQDLTAALFPPATP